MNILDDAFDSLVGLLWVDKSWTNAAEFVHTKTYRGSGARYPRVHVIVHRLYIAPVLTDMVYNPFVEDIDPLDGWLASLTSLAQ